MSNNSESTERSSIDQAIEYLKVLQEGRVKPDKNGVHSIVKDSIDNTQDIERIKRLLNNYFTKYIK